MKNKTFLTITASIAMSVTSVGALASNPIMEVSKHPHGTLPLNKITAEQYEEAVKEGIRIHKAEIEKIANNPEPATFENTIVAMDRSGELLSTAELALSNVEHATGDTLLMNVTAKLTPLLSHHSNDIILNEALFARVKDVYNKQKDDKNLTDEQRRLIELTYKGFENSGANLSEADREKYRKLSAELSELNLKFSQNVSNGMKAADRMMWLKLEDLEGLPQSAITAARAAAKEELENQGKADDESLYMVNVFYPSYAPFMKYAKRRDLREKLYYLYNSRNIGGEFDNVQLLKDIANVRLEIAKLLGKKNFAEYKLQETMAGSPKAVMDLLNQLKDAYTPAMKAELKEIEDFARQTEGADFNLQAWDYSYWADKLKADRYAFNDEDMRPYFELNKTIGGVFGLATKLYGFTFKENKKIPVYHPDVRAYDVYGPDKKLLGVLYADFYNRAGKAPGAWMTEFRGEEKDDKGVRQIPFISIVCNFTKPVGKDPVLLTPAEVETFMHEFGHALHGLSAMSTYASMSGTNVFHDFVEVFSQFNENFLPHKEFLDTFAVHYKTGEKMPQDLLNKFVKSQQFGAGYACIRQLNFGFLDMAYHTLTEPLRASADIAAFEEEALAPVKLFDALPGTSISSAFGHIFSGGYAAGYYGYKWAELLDADAFSAFLENGILDKTTAAKFKKMMETGGSADPMKIYVEFRGRKPSIDAMLRRDGIIK